MTSDDALLYFKVSAWLHREAELLDNRREAEWLETMVDPSISYRVPLRQTMRRVAGAGFVEDAYHLDETWGSLQTRVARLSSDYAWGDDPPARARHFVTNVQVGTRSEAGLEVRSSVMLARSRGDQAIAAVITGDRHDLLVEHGEDFRLARRTVLLDLTVIETSNLSVIF